MHNIKVGQVLFMRGVLNSVKPVKVCKVGKSYFYINGGVLYSKKSILLTTLCYEHRNWPAQSFKVFLTEKEVKDEIDIEILSRKIRSKIGEFGKINTTLDALRKIDKLL